MTEGGGGRGEKGVLAEPQAWRHSSLCVAPMGPDACPLPTGSLALPLPSALQECGCRPTGGDFLPLCTPPLLSASPAPGSLVHSPRGMATTCPLGGFMGAEGPPPWSCGAGSDGSGGRSEK